MNPAQLIRFAVDALHAVFVRDQREPTDLEWEFVDQLVLHFPEPDRGPGSLLDTYEAFINNDSAATVEDVRHEMWLALLRFVRQLTPAQLRRLHKLAQVKEAEHEHQHDPGTGKKPTGVNPPRTCPTCGQPFDAAAARMERRRKREEAAAESKRRRKRIMRARREAARRYGPPPINVAR